MLNSIVGRLSSIANNRIARQWLLIRQPCTDKPTSPLLICTSTYLHSRVYLSLWSMWMVFPPLAKTPSTPVSCATHGRAGLMVRDSFGPFVWYKPHRNDQRFTTPFPSVMWNPKLCDSLTNPITAAWCGMRQRTKHATPVLSGILYERGISLREMVKVKLIVIGSKWFLGNTKFENTSVILTSAQNEWSKFQSCHLYIVMVCIYVSLCSKEISFQTFNPFSYTPPTPPQLKVRNGLIIARNWWSLHTQLESVTSVCIPH